MKEAVLELSARGGRIAAGGELFAGGPFAGGFIAGGLFASGLNAATRSCITLLAAVDYWLFACLCVCVSVFSRQRHHIQMLRSKLGETSGLHAGLVVQKVHATETTSPVDAFG